MKLETKKKIKEQTKTKKKENECQVSKLTIQNSRNWLQSETFAQSLQNVPAIDKWKVHLKKEKKARINQTYPLQRSEAPVRHSHQNIDKWKAYLKKENEISNEQHGRTNR